MSAPSSGSSSGSGSGAGEGGGARDALTQDERAREKATSAPDVTPKPDPAVQEAASGGDTERAQEASTTADVALAAEPAAEVIDVRRGMFGTRGADDTSGYGGLVRTIAFGAPTPRPYGGWFDAVADGLEAALERAGTHPSAAIEKGVVDRGELTLFVRREHLLAVAQLLRDEPDLRFELCLGVSGVHYPHEQGRELHAVYHLASVTHGRRLRVETTCPDTDRHVPSLVSVYPTNDWHEREAWDFFGIVFDGHPSLTRIEMPDDWPGHPQRKDYPLGGIPVEYKGAQVPPPDTRRSYA